jgi:hypothetical protein
MFKNVNRNWLKVLLPELITTAATVSIFFLGRFLGMENGTASAITFVIIVIVAFATTIAAAAASTTFITAAAAVVAAAVAAVIVFPVAVVVVVAIGAIAVATAVATKTAINEYSLSKSWVAMSFLGEIVLISLPFYFALN